VDRLVRNLAGTITLYLRDDDGGLVDATGNVTLTVKNAIGTVVTSGTATRASLGTYTFTLIAANNAVLDTYEVTWSATVAGQAGTYVTRHEVVGAHLFGVADLRTYDTSMTAATYPGADVRKARDEATDQLERPGSTFGSLRGVRVTLDGSGTDTLRIPHTLVSTVLSCTVDGTSISPANIAAYGDGRLVLPDGVWASGYRNVVLHYEAGWTNVPPPLATAAMILSRERLVQNTAAGSMRATAQITGDFAFRLTIPGRDGWTGIPQVDEAIREYLFPDGKG
jgi:hypothetical protein